MDEQKVLVVDDLSVLIKERFLVKNVSFSLNQGDVLGIVGEDKSGKTSLIKALVGSMPISDGKVYIYYASSDTRMHVAETDVERLKDYVFNTPEDPLRSPDCVRQRAELIRRNLEYMRNQ